MPITIRKQEQVDYFLGRWDMAYGKPNAPVSTRRCLPRGGIITALVEFGMPQLISF